VVNDGSLCDGWARSSAAQGAKFDSIGGGIRRGKARENSGEYSIAPLPTISDRNLAQERDQSLDQEANASAVYELGLASAEIAHELRNALQVITTQAFAARRAPEKSAQVLLVIERQAAKAQALVNDVLALLKGPENLRKDRVATQAVLTDALEGLQNSMVWRTEIALDELFCHPSLLARLIHILLENAVQMKRNQCGENVQILARVWQENAFAFIEVEDNGPGIPPTIATTLFDPMVSERPGGTGLGLSLARRIVQAHGGQISVVPPQELGGACFRIALLASPPRRVGV
jgi:signal transduction histidine kinase